MRPHCRAQRPELPRTDQYAGARELLRKRTEGIPAPKLGERNVVVLCPTREIGVFQLVHANAKIRSSLRLDCHPALEDPLSLLGRQPIMAGKCGSALPRCCLLKLGASAIPSIADYLRGSKLSNPPFQLFIHPRLKLFSKMAFARFDRVVRGTLREPPETVTLAIPRIWAGSLHGIAAFFGVETSIEELIGVVGSLGRSRRWIGRTTEDNQATDAEKPAQTFISCDSRVSARRTPFFRSA